MRAMATTTKTLLMSDDGQIGCSIPSHAPFPGTDTWRTYGWRPMTLQERMAYEAEIGRAPECESCRADARRATS